MFAPFLFNTELHIMNNYNFIVPGFLSVKMCCSKYVSFHLGMLTGPIHFRPELLLEVTFILACKHVDSPASIVHRQICLSVCISVRT
jgi:hypothetical protein